MYYLVNKKGGEISVPDQFEGQDSLGTVWVTKQEISQDNALETKTVYYNGMQYYFLADITEGEFGTGKGEEFTGIDRNRGVYKPMWVEVKHISTIDVRPKEIAEKETNLFW